MAENAQEQLDLEEVIFAPAGDPPHKSPDSIVDAADRLRMVELAIDGQPGFSTSRIDMEHPGPSYTWKLLERLQDRTAADLWFIVGSDSLADFATWARPDRILELARIAVIERPGYPLAEPTDPTVPGLNERLDRVETPMCSVSASELRHRIETGRSIRYLVPDAVRDYICQRGLYRPDTSVDSPGR